MKQKIYLAFDIDGTLFDISDAVVEGFRLGIERFMSSHPEIHVPLPGFDEIVRLLGIPIPIIFKTLFPGMSEGNQQEINDACNDTLSLLIRRGKGRIMEGVPETMRVLHEKKYIMLAASNGRKEYIESVLETYDIAQYFSPPFMYLDNTIRYKTELVRYYRDNVSKGSLLIMIGDRITDRAAASGNGIPFIACSFGSIHEHEIAGTRWVVRNFREIPGVIEEIISGVDVLKGHV
jgi:phosphoglycolate phosphatase